MSTTGDVLSECLPQFPRPAQGRRVRDTARARSPPTNQEGASSMRPESQPPLPRFTLLSSWQRMQTLPVSSSNRHCFFKPDARCLINSVDNNIYSSFVIHALVVSVNHTIPMNNRDTLPDFGI